MIAQEAPLPVGLACSFAKQVASALDAAHKLGMIHRDIKPDNIVLVGDTGVPAVGNHGQDGHATRDRSTSPTANSSPRPLGGEGGRRPGEGADHPIAKVLDFGIAKMKEGLLETSGIGMTLTGTGMAVGTPSHMSPEQALGKKGDELDGRSDTYSLGVVMYQMLTGELPLKAETPIQMLMAHIQTPPRPLRETQHGAQTPDGVSQLVMACLSKARDERPVHAKALIEKIEYCEEEPARQEAARRKSRGRPTGPRARRGRTEGASEG